MLLVTLPLLVAAVQAAIVSKKAASLSDRKTEERRQREDISPELEPKSDKKFFKKDYPWDKRPVADKYYVFDHPYPAVQDGGDFDKDFVKDENSDGGRWQAQMDYDTLRSKIRAAKEKLRQLKEKMEKEYEDWMQAKERAANGAQILEEAEKATEAARKAAEEAARKVNELEGRSQKDGTKVGGEIGDAVKKVQDEMDDLEKCKKALAEAKQKLKKLLKEKEEQEARDKAAKAEEEKKKAAEEERRKSEAAEKSSKEKDISQPAAGETTGKTTHKEEEDIPVWDEEKWARRLERAEAEHNAARKKYEQELKDVKVTEDQLARAAENLRKFRRPPYVDDNGGVYNVPRSPAVSVHVSAVTAISVLTLAFFA